LGLSLARVSDMTKTTKQLINGLTAEVVTFSHLGKWWASASISHDHVMGAKSETEEEAITSAVFNAMAWELSNK
jgi:hypothetical protein